MSLYFKYFRMLLNSQMQYRASFWLLCIGQFFTPFVTFAGMYFLFERFGQIKGWDFFEVALCFAVIHMAFSISECLARGFDSFANLVIKGEFDRILVRPRSTILQILGSNIEFTRVGRLTQSAIVLIWSVRNIAVDWDIFKLATLFLMVTGGVFIFTGIFILAATMCFWTVQGLEVANVFTDGGKEMAQYPLSIYQKWIVRFFTYVIPFGCVNYLPLRYILGKNNGGSEILDILMPAAGILFILPCLAVWHFGVRHYRSTGS